MPVEKLQSYLDQNRIKYVIINHSPAYTARETAASTLIPRREFAKAVMIKPADQSLVMAVVPASRHVNLNALAEATGAKATCLADEKEFEPLFPGCEPGAVPPFGGLYGVTVYADRELLEEDDLAFCAGNHSQIIRLSCEDYKRLTNPAVGDFAVKE